MSPFITMRMETAFLKLPFRKGFDLAFTLVELLVVIAILSILAAILLTALSRAKSVDHKAVCLNNQRQIGIARQLYANDNDSVLVARFPAAVHSTLLNAFHTMWSDALCFDYLGGQTNLFDCPAEKRIPRVIALVDSSLCDLRDMRESWCWGYLQNDLGGRPVLSSRSGEKTQFWGILGGSADWFRRFNHRGLRESSVVSPSRMIA